MIDRLVLHVGLPGKLHYNGETKDEFKFARYAMCMCKYFVILMTSNLKTFVFVVRDIIGAA